MNNKIGDYVIKENSLFYVTESKLIFKNKNIILKVNQISDVKLIKTRSSRLIITILALLYVLYISLSPYFALYGLSSYSTIGLASLFFSLSIKRFSYKLVIRMKNHNFHEIAINTDNLSFATVLVNQFSSFISLLHEGEQLSKIVFSKPL